MTLLLHVIVALAVWVVLGAAVLATLDDEQGSLLAWAKQCPLGGATTVILVWPVIAMACIFYKRD